MTCKFGISGAYRLACRGGKRTTGAKHLHVNCTCTMLHTPFGHTAPSRPCQGVPMYVPSLVSLAQNFLKPKDPWSKRFSAPGACNQHPTQMAPQWILSWHSMYLRLGSVAPPVSPSGPRENDAFKTLARALHVHYAVMHPRLLLHTAPSRPCGVYRVWCR